VTNNHVIGSETEANDAVIQFNYQRNMAGLDLQPTSVSLDPNAGFQTSRIDDWTLVRVQGDANADWGAIEIAEVAVRTQDYVNIIQHPSGGPKQVALYHNLVTAVGDGRVQYLTDTLPGSSGSPVFNKQWQVVALHHSGGWIVEPGTRNSVFRNEGIHMNRIFAALETSGFR
jgi:V8-like Glu-specific endopeptidase